MVGNPTRSPSDTAISRRTALRLTGGVAALSLAGCLGAAETEEFDHEDWLSLGHNAGNTGKTSVRGPDSPDERWSVDTEPISTAPVVADDVVYAGAADGTLYALDLETGDELWTYSVGDDLYYTPTVTENRIYVADTDTIHAVTTDGDEAWTADADGRVHSACAVSDGRLHVSTDVRASILTLEADSGDELWRESGAGLGSTPAVADGTVYSVGQIIEFDTDGEPEDAFQGAVALDAETGERQWLYDEWDGDGGLPMSSPAVDDERLYVGTGSGERPLLALDRNSGEEQWRLDPDAPELETAHVANAPPVVDGDTVYVSVSAATSSDTLHLVDDDQDPSSVVAVDAETGESRWVSGTDELGPAVAMGSDALYRHTFGQVTALEPDDGAPIWTHDSEFGLPWEDIDEIEAAQLTAGTQPAVVDGMVVATSPSGGIYAVGED